MAEVPGVEESALKLLETAGTDATKQQAALASVVELLTKFTHEQGEKVVNAWRNVLPQIFTKYHDGYIANDLTEKDIRMTKLFYPRSWLEATGFFDNHAASGPDVIMFEPNPLPSAGSNYMLKSEAVMQTIWAVFFTTLIVGGLTWLVFSRMYAEKLMGVTIKRSEYTPIV